MASDAADASAAAANNIVLKYCKIDGRACSPTRGSNYAAGLDLRSISDHLIPPHDRAIVCTGLKIELPPNCYGRIAPRSGLAVNNCIQVGAGVTDCDYRGEIKIVLFNHSATEPFRIQKGDRIAQLICERIYYPKLVEVKELNDTERGVHGFGSTGIN